MVLLSARGITKHYGPEPVLSGVTFDIRRGERIALLGPNGAGKTTLLRILAGKEDADSGEVELHPSATLGVLEQRPEFSSGRRVWDEARDGLKAVLQLTKCAEQLAHEISVTEDEQQRQRLGRQFDDLQQQLHQRDGYHIDHKIERVLQGLGFSVANFHQPVAQLSGGQRSRLMLAKLLLRQPDVLLLDEPTNHLDIQATQWLERFLDDSHQTLIVVSHDRYLLDRVANRTLELLRASVDSFSGNYSAYRRQKEERLKVQRRTFERQQAEIAKMEDFVRRNRYGQKHAQAEDRQRKLERIERVEIPREITAPAMGFSAAERSGDIVLRAEHLAKSFAAPLFQDLTFDVLRGEKWGILGPNGSGKTTLLRCLLGEEPHSEGRVVLGSGVSLGYLDQQLACLDGGSPVVEAIRPPNREVDEPRRRNLLARFGITGDMAFQPVHSLSGGERSRVALAMLAAREANLMILDEPTNHLDLWARESLERSLREFNGTVVLVSHDRYFLNRVVDHLLVLDPSGYRIVEGNYDTYLHLISQHPADAGRDQAAFKSAGARETGNAPEHQTQPLRKRRKFPYRKVADLEREIHEHETRVEQLHIALATPDVLRDGNRVKQTTAELDQEQRALKVLYEHWEEAIELN